MPGLLPESLNRGAGAPEDRPPVMHALAPGPTGAGT